MAMPQSQVVRRKQTVKKKTGQESDHPSGLLKEQAYHELRARILRNEYLPERFSRNASWRPNSG